MRRLYLVDSILWFNLAGFTATGDDIYDRPVIIKGKWDVMRKDMQLNEKVETISRSVTVYPDRVLSIGSVLVLGDEEFLAKLTPAEIRDPHLLESAVTVKTQSTIAEFGKPQKASYPVGYKSKHLTIEVTCS